MFFDFRWMGWNSGNSVSFGDGICLQETHHTLILDSRCHVDERTGTAINNPSLKFEMSWNINGPATKIKEVLTADGVGRHLHDYYNNETSQPCIRHWLTIQNQAEQNKGNHFESDTRKPFMSGSTSQEAFICSRVWLLISSTLHRKKETSIHNNGILHHFATPASYCIAHFSMADFQGYPPNATFPAANRQPDNRRWLRDNDG